MTINRRKPFLLLICGLGLVSAAQGLAAPPAHPRLILTSERIAALKVERETVRRDFWPAARQSADDFAALRIPVMEFASNRYRTFGDTMPALGLAWHMTGDRRYVEAADRWLQAILAVPKWNGSQNLGRSAWAMGAALLHDWLHEELPVATRERVRERLAAEAEILLRETSYWRLLSNHCLIEVAAMGMIGLSLDGEHERAGAFLAEARKRADLIIEHAPLDGSWGEGIQYWQYGLGHFLRYLEAAKTTGHHDYYPRYDWLRQTGFFPINFSLPGVPGETVNFGDSGDYGYFAGFLHYLPASVYRNGYFQDYGNRTRSTHVYKFSWMDFIAYDPTVEPVDFTTLPLFKHFEDNGFVIMRSGWGEGSTLLGFHCGPGPGHRNQGDPRRLERRGFGPGHAHPDINGFSLFAHGQWLALDPGYARPKWTRDENTLLVNGHGQVGEGKEWLDYMAFQNREPAPRILRAETHPEFDYVIGDAGNVYPDEAGLAHFRRHLLFLKPSTVVILDDVATRTKSRVDWLLQARDRAERTGSDTFEILRNGVRLWVRPLQPARYEANVTTRAMRASGTDGKLTTLSLAVESGGRSSFLVVMGALKDASVPPPETGFADGRLRITHGDRSWTIAITDPADSSDPAARLMNLVER